MDFHLKQWRNRHESEQQQHQPSAKVPKLLLGPYHRQHQQQQHQDPSGYSAVPLFVPETNSKISSNLSAFPDSNTSFTWMGSYFSLAQWQELELQALIYKYMLPGAALIPNSSNKSREVFFFTLRHISSTTHLQHCFHHQPAAWYWGRAAMDPEPGRCRRTDGKKWRCSKDMVAGQSYCERHVHRGHNSSRKPVEMRTSSTTANTVMPDSNATAPHLGSASGAAGVGFVIGCG